MIRRGAFGRTLEAAALATSLAAQAQLPAFPSHAIKVILPASFGGATDTIARAVQGDEGADQRDSGG